jgi:hypothetical protein
MFQAFCHKFDPLCKLLSKIPVNEEVFNKCECRWPNEDGRERMTRLIGSKFPSLHTLTTGGSLDDSAC